MSRAHHHGKRIWFGLTLAGVVFVLMAGVCEIAIRATHPEWSQPRLRLSEEIVHHPVLGWAGQPGFRGAVGPEKIDVRINPQGFRDEDFTEKLRRSEAEERMRVLFIGDSLTYGYKLPEPERLSEQFEAVAMARGRRVESFNAGIPGYGTGQEFRTLEELLPVVRPQLVVMWYCSNDIGDSALPYDYRLVHRVYKPFYDLDGQLIFNHTVPVRFSHRVRESWLGSLEICYFIDWLGYRWEDAAHVREVQLWNSPLLEGAPRLTHDEQNLFVSNLGAMTQIPRMRPYYDINKRRNLALWGRMQELCRTQDSRLILLFDDRDSASTTPELMQELSDRGQEVLAYGEAFQPFRPWGGVWGDGHPNAVQNYVSALALADRLDNTRTPVDFALAPWIDAIPDHLNFRRSHSRSLLFGSWGRWSPQGRQAGTNALCILAPAQADAPMELMARGHAVAPARVRLWCSGQLVGEVACAGGSPFELSGRLPHVPGGLLCLRVEAEPDVVMEEIRTSPATGSASE